MVYRNAVVLRESFRDPQGTRRCRFCPIPRSKLNRPQPFHVPCVEEFMSRCTERPVIAGAIGKNAGLDDLSRVEVLHTIARAIVSDEVE